MKKIKLCCYWGNKSVTTLNLKNNSDIALSCLHRLNDLIIENNNGKLPDANFYYLSYISSSNNRISLISFTGYSRLSCSLSIQYSKLRNEREKIVWENSKLDYQL